MNYVYLDIETIPCQSPSYYDEVRSTITAPAQYKVKDSIDKWIAENGDAAAREQVAKTSFNPALGHICTIGYAIDDGNTVALHSYDIKNEADIIEQFFNNLPTVGQNCIIGHNVVGFDIRFILCRAIILGVKIPHKVVFPRDPKPWDDSVFDTMIAWSGAKDRISQDNLCRALGLQGKGDFNGSMVAQAWANGEHDKIALYCREDVEAVRAIHKRFLAVGY